jgi:hypothetical protein
MSHGGSKLDILQAPVTYLEKFGINTKIILILCGLGMSIFSFFYLELDTNAILGYVFILAPLWLPFLMFHLFFEAWLDYVRLEFDIAQERVTLEIKIPQEIFKSPQAMELVLQQLYQTASPDNHFQTYIDGKHPPTYSLELVSRGGDIRFYINVPRKKYKNMAETNLYAQYPGIEVHELELDYTAEIPWDPETFGYFSLHFGLKKNEGYPIKTYIDYGLDQMPKEEEKIDPISTWLELLGSIGPNEYIWVQILINANTDTNFKTGTLSEVPDWKQGARDLIKEIMSKAADRVGKSLEEAGGSITQLLTEAEKDTIRAIDRSISKVAFNTISRTMYIARKENFLPGERIGAIITAWRAYDDLNRNQFGFKWRTDFDWNMWQDPSGKKRDAMKEHELFNYKMRVLHPESTSYRWNVMTTEELATMWHIPGKVVTTPTLARIPSKRAEAPSNLPV